MFPCIASSTLSLNVGESGIKILGLTGEPAGEERDVKVGVPGISWLGRVNPESGEVGTFGEM